MEYLKPRPDFQEENRQARNSEDSLLAVLGIFQRLTKQISKIDFPSPDAFGTLLARIQGQRTEPSNPVCFYCLSYLDLSGCLLVMRDFLQADFRESNLKGAHLERAHLEGAHLEGANLEGANLKGANLERAYLVGANFEWAHLERANFEWANLERAHLEGANLERAHLERANLKNTILEGKAG